ncbi:hypothetical protein BDR03DRAFT_959073 [Suillus americanus]|nr:hypothetical protein BDR03DRAFT_959073 [Suillus americanus]
MGVLPTVAQPSYPSAPSLVQPSHNQRLEQVPEQPAPEIQAPVTAAEESAVKRGKRKAVDLDDDDAPPRKKQMIHPLLYYPDFELVESNGEARYKCCLTQCENAPAVRQAGIKGHIRSKRHQKVRARLPSPGRDEAVTRVDSSNIGGSGSKNQADEASRRPFEGFTSSQPLEDATANPAWDEQVKELFSIINKAAESTLAKQLEKAVEGTAKSALGEQLEEVVNNPEVAADSALGEQLEEFINSLDGADDSAPDDILEYCMNNFDGSYNPAPGESLEDLLNCFLSSK